MTRFTFPIYSQIHVRLLTETRREKGSDDRWLVQVPENFVKYIQAHMHDKSIN